MYRRIAALEEQARRRRPPSRSAARERMKEHLNRISELRRGDATVENNDELAAMREAVRRRRDRGEGASYGPL